MGAIVPTHRATRTSLADVLLSIFAFVVGCLVGRLRGGRLSGISETRLHAKGALVFGLTTVLVLTLIGPAFAIGWLLVGYGCFFIFGLKNLQITGMIVLLIGLLMNVAPALANGAVPVSELALVSVDDVDENGAPNIDGVRESSDTASSLSALGDVVPVPLVNVVVSLGDLVMLVALADIAANLMLRARTRELAPSEELEELGITFSDDARRSPNPAPSRIPVLSPLSRAFTSRPAHAAHRRTRLRHRGHSSHAPEHATEPPEPVIVLDGSDAYIEQPPPPAGPPVDELEIAVIPTHEPVDPSTIDLTEKSDRRPIIDLTTSPTDEQLCEFLRRRQAADEQLDKLAPPSPGHRRGRRGLRRQRASESTEFAETIM